MKTTMGNKVNSPESKIEEVLSKNTNVIQQKPSKSQDNMDKPGYKCTICPDYITDTQDDLKEHINYVHKNSDEDVIANMLKQLENVEKSSMNTENVNPTSTNDAPHTTAKIERSKEECQRLINTMKDFRTGSFFGRGSAMCCIIEPYIIQFREMKPYFSNQDDVEDDIQEYIAKISEEHSEIYDLCIKEVVWTIDFLLSNPHVNAEKEIKDLHVFYNEIQNYDFQEILNQMYQHHFMRQLPKEI